MKKSKIYRFLFILFFSISFLSVFDWFVGGVRILFIIFLFIILDGIGHDVNKKIFRYSIFALCVHLFSFVFSIIYFSLPVDFSWFVQGIILILLIPSASVITTDKVRAEFEHIAHVFFWITLTVGIFGILVGLKESGVGWILEGYDHRLTYQFVASLDIGIIKQLYPFFLILLFIISWQRFSEKLRLPILVINLLLLFLLGSRSILFALFVISLLLYLKRMISFGKLKKGSLVIIFLTGISLIFLFNNQIYKSTTESGRFYYQLFSSEVFWSRPFGVGFGNYTKSIESNLWDNIKIDQFSKDSLEKLLINTDFSIKHSLFPIAESDLILVGATFGFLGLIFWLLLGFYCVNKVLFFKKNDDKTFFLAFILFAFIFFSGFLNDYLSFIPTWLFLGYSFNNMVKQS